MQDAIQDLGPDIALRLAGLLKNGWAGWPGALVATALSGVTWLLLRKRK